MAATYHELGTLAQARGDLTEAETQYRRSLDISERLGNQQGRSATISQLGFLAAERNEFEQAIGLHGRALAIRARIETPKVGFDAHQLQKLRPFVSPEVFARALATAVGDDIATQIVELLDGIGEAETKDEG